jgi:hypothetical protein
MAVSGKSGSVIVSSDINNDKSFSCALGEFTWESKERPNMQKGWLLAPEIRAKIADGAINYFVLSLNASKIESRGGLGGIEIILNSLITRFKIDYSSFPWHWSSASNTGGWISYADLLKESYVKLDSGTLSLKYKMAAHPYFDAFKTAMSRADWGEIAIQYGLGISNLPFINAYFHESC